MNRLRQALAILVDESRPIRERLNELIPVRGPAFVPRLGKAVLTPILLISYPDRYGVWNQVSEGALKQLRLWPEFARNASFGERYERVNELLLELASGVGANLWTLDGIFWRVIEADEVTDAPELADDGDVATPASGVGPNNMGFGLEKHLQEFPRDNWNKTSLGSEWKIFEEDGDPEAGYEYPCDIGRIDLLAHHRPNRAGLSLN